MRQRKETPMKRFLNTHIHMLAIFLLLGSLPAVAVEHPFSLYGAGTVTFTGGNPPTGGDVTASGTATHLGQWTEDEELQFTYFSNSNLIKADGSGTFTAADGDQLFTEIHGAVLDPATGIATGTFLFVGGTGRFEGASGSADFVVLQDPSGPFEVTAVGSIDY
jgi:hypothetical protein